MAGRQGIRCEDRETEVRKEAEARAVVEAVADLLVARGSRVRSNISTAMVEEDRLKYHLVRPLGERPLAGTSRDELQKLLELRAKTLSKSVVSHLRFRLRSIFDLAISEAAVDRNPAKELYTPRNCAPSRARRLLSLEDLDEMIQ